MKWPLSSITFSTNSPPTYKKNFNKYNVSDSGAKFPFFIKLLQKHFQKLMSLNSQFFCCQRIHPVF